MGDNHLGISALDDCPFPLQYALRLASGSGAPGCPPNIICSTSAVSFSMCPPRASNSVQAPGLAAFMLTLGATSLLQEHPRPQWVRIWPPASAVLLDAHIPLNPPYKLSVLSRIGRSPSLRRALTLLISRSAPCWIQPDKKKKNSAHTQLVAPEFVCTRFQLDVLSRVRCEARASVPSLLRPLVMGYPPDSDRNCSIMSKKEVCSYRVLELAVCLCQRQAHSFLRFHLFGRRVFLLLHGKRFG